MLHFLSRDTSLKSDHVIELRLLFSSFSWWQSRDQDGLSHVITEETHGHVIDQSRTTWKEKKKRKIKKCFFDPSPNTPRPACPHHPANTTMLTPWDGGVGARGCHKKGT
jgi:hypothetical protein